MPIFAPIESDPTGEFPFDGWFNGDGKKMIEAGTYERFRPRLVQWAEKDVLFREKLSYYDKLFSDSQPVSEESPKKRTKKS